jgi:hypothetical protein
LPFESTPQHTGHPPPEPEPEPVPVPIGVGPASSAQGPFPLQMMGGVPVPEPDPVPPAEPPDPDPAGCSGSEMGPLEPLELVPSTRPGGQGRTHDRTLVPDPDEGGAEHSLESPLPSRGQHERGSGKVVAPDSQAWKTADG